MINITDNFRVNKPAPIDDRLGPFLSTALALSSIELDRRYIGLTVIVDDGTGAVDYWFKDGVTNGDLEAKSTGGGGSQNLQQVTDEGNTTTNDIQLIDDAELIFGAGGGVLLDNGSRLREGTIDAETGGSKGIAQICGVGYELKWEAGSLYVMNSSGNIIREVRYKLTTTPTATDDVTKGFVQNSRWVLDNGDLYVCTDATANNAVWELVGFVPYTGANQNVDLGTYNLTADQLNLNVSPTGALAVGGTQWNNTNGSSETLLKGGSVTLKNGVDLVARVVNKVSPNTTLTKASYQVVKVAGAQGQRLAVELARANNDLNSADTLGMVTETIAPNQEGFILTVGQIEGINTTGSLQGETWADGDVLYLSPTTAGGITNVKPNGLTGHIVVIGYVEYAHANNGKIYVKIMNGWELAELHDVYINPATLANSDVLVYDSTAELWQNTKPWLIGAPYTIYNSSAAAAIATTIDFTINTSQLRNGSTIILQGYISRATGTGTATFSWTANSNANIASQSFTSGTQYGIQFYWTAKYISGTNSLRFFRTPTTSFVNNTTLATTFFDVVAISGVFTINFRATVTAGTMTGATENLTAQIIY